MSDAETEAILQHIRESGYAVEAGTAGYQVRMAATGPDGEKHVVTADDTRRAARKLAEEIGLSPPDAPE